MDSRLTIWGNCPNRPNRPSRQNCQERRARPKLQVQPLLPLPSSHVIHFQTVHPEISHSTPTSREHDPPKLFTSTLIRSETVENIVITKKYLHSLADGIQAWKAEEDALLITMLHDLIKTHLWPMIKADGRLVHRTSYGAQYHARVSPSTRLFLRWGNYVFARYR